MRIKTEEIKFLKLDRIRTPEVLHLMRLGYSYLSCENKEKLIVDPENDINVSYTDLTNKVYVKINILRTKNYPSYEIGCYRC